MYFPKLNKQELLPPDIFSKVVRIKHYLDQWRPLFIKELGQDVDDAISATLLTTLTNFKDYNNEEHLERYIKKVALSFAKSKKDEVEFLDYMSINITNEQPLRVFDINPHLLEVLLSNSRDLLHIQDLLLNSHKSTPLYDIEFFDNTFQESISQYLITGDITLSDITTFFTLLHPYAVQLSDLILQSNYLKRYTILPILETLPTTFTAQVDISKVRGELRLFEPTRVSQITKKLTISTSLIKIDTESLYISQNGKLSYNVTDWYMSNLESVIYTLDTYLQTTYNYRLLGVYKDVVYFKAITTRGINKLEVYPIKLYQYHSCNLTILHKEDI